MADLDYIDSSLAVQIVDEENSTQAVIDADGNVAVKEAVSDDMEGGGKIAVGSTSAVEVTFSGTPTSIIIRADKDNTGLVFVGESNVANDGSNAFTFLDAGDAVTIDYDDTTNAVYVISDTADQNFWKGAIL